MGEVRKHIDSFLDKIKNRIGWILKNYDFQTNIHIWKLIKQQLDILREYIGSSKSLTNTIHVIFEFSELLIILKMNFIDCFVKIGPFETNKNEIKLIEKHEYSEYRIHEDLLDLYTSFMDILSKLVINTGLSMIIHI